MPKAREGESMRGGSLSLGGGGGILSASMCVFNGVLCVWDQILVVSVTKIFLVA